MKHDDLGERLDAEIVELEKSIRDYDHLEIDGWARMTIKALQKRVDLLTDLKAERDAPVHKKLIAEYEAMPDDGYFEPLHPIFQMAQEIDTLKADNERLREALDGFMDIGCVSAPEEFSDKFVLVNEERYFAARVVGFGALEKTAKQAIKEKADE